MTSIPRCHLEDACMTDAESELHHFDRRMVWAGFRQLAPISIFVTLFGAAFGLAAVQTGLDDSVILAMSALVFPGASQFAALELWGTRSDERRVGIECFRMCRSRWSPLHSKKKNKKD